MAGSTMVIALRKSLFGVYLMCQESLVSKHSKKCLMILFLILLFREWQWRLVLHPSKK